LIIRHLLPLASVCLLLSAVAAAQDVPARPSPAPPATKPTPLTYAEIVDRAVEANANLAAVEVETQARLKALSGVFGPDADEQRKAALIKRRLADRQAWSADRRLKLHWLAESAPELKGELAELDPDEQDALLDARSVAQKLFVPLPPRKFEKTPIEEVLTWIETRTEVRMVADWPALTKVGVSKIDVISVEIGRYDKPAMETLKGVISALGLDRAVMDPRQSDSVLISTPEGLGQLQERDRLLSARVRNGAAWTAAPLLKPAAYTQVPLLEVLERMLGDTSTEVHWDRLAALQIGPQTPVSLTIGVHRLGHALALLADVLNAIAQKPNAIAFDLSPDGVVILSDKRGLVETLAAADWLATAVANDPPMRKQLSRPIGDVRGEKVPLVDAVNYIRQAAELDLRPDWQSLAASGLSEQSVVTLDLPNPSAAQVLRLLFMPAEGRPPVTWKVDGQALVVKSAG